MSENSRVGNSYSLYDIAELVNFLACVLRPKGDVCLLVLKSDLLVSTIIM